MGHQIIHTSIGNRGGSVADKCNLRVILLNNNVTIDYDLSCAMTQSGVQSKDFKFVVKCPGLKSPWHQLVEHTTLPSLWIPPA
jgi:hypothetical protein